MITYSVVNQDTVANEETQLTAKTDRGARMQAKKVAQKMKSWYIKFYRATDGCVGKIDK